MYLAHIIILNLYYQWFQPVSEHAYIVIPLIAVSTFITVYLVIWLLARLPKSKYLVG